MLTDFREAIIAHEKGKVMQQASIEQRATAIQQMAMSRETIAYLQEEWRKFNEWAVESRSISPFGDLALHWHAGHLTIAEGRRIEKDQQIAHFMKQD